MSRIPTLVSDKIIQILSQYRYQIVAKSFSKKCKQKFHFLTIRHKNFPATEKQCYLARGGGERLMDGGSIDGLKYFQPLVEGHFVQ